MDLAKNINTFSFSTGENDAATIEDLNKTIQSMQRTLEKVELDYRVYDIYNIQSQITSASDFDIKVNSLINNSATIINCPTSIIKNFNGQQQTFLRGDIIYKNNSGDLNIIRSESGGWYKPHFNSDTSTITFEFSNTDTEPVEIKTDVGAESRVYGYMGQVANNQAYYQFTFNKVLLNGAENPDDYVEPIVKTYIMHSAQSDSETSGWEEIIIDRPLMKITNNPNNNIQLDLWLNTTNMAFDNILYAIK